MDTHITVKRIDEARAKDVLTHAEFHNTPFNNDQLTHDHLLKTDLIPRYEFAVHDGMAWLSDHYYLIDKRVAVVGYVQSKDQPPVIRSYYRSKSQGVLRHLADYMIKDGLFDWYAKGHEHAHITACIAMQKAFAQVEKDNIPRYVDQHELIFAGASRERKPGEPPYRGTSGEPEPLKGNFYAKVSDRVPPHELIFTDDSEAPDFSAKLDTWVKQPEAYGEVTVEIFASKNKVYNYMFCRDTQKRAWIGMVEKAAGTFKSTGVIKPWVTAGDLITPAYEYATLAHGYGNDTDRKGPYVDMYKNYLSKVPIIKKYLDQI